MKKLNGFLVSIMLFMASYIFDLCYLPVYICVTGALCYIYAMVSDVLSMPYIMPLWKLFLIALGSVFLVVSTVLNAVSIHRIKKRFQKASAGKEEE